MADRVTNKTVSIGTTPIQVAGDVEPGQRKFISIINTSTGAQKISLSIGADAIAGQGIVLSPGGSYSDSSDGVSYFPLEYAHNLVADLAGGSVSVIERIGRGI